VTTTAGRAADEGTADALRLLDGRSWAQLLRALRAVPDLPDALVVQLRHPTSELTSGSARGRLCDALAAADAVLAVLSADVALPAAVHAAIASRAPAAPDAAEAPDAPADATLVEDGPDRSARRDRGLRRTLEDERRRREGAEARALAAEARAADADAARSVLEGRSAVLERELADAADAVRQAAERAERRAESRIAGLERDLASGRSAYAALRREHDRAQSELATAHAEIARLQEEVDRAPRPVADRAAGRPLVLPPELGPDTTEAASWLARRVSLLLVDGYNVSLALRAGHPLEEQRRWLIERLRPLVARGNATPVVIFDGDGPAGSRRDTSGVEVRFTAAGTTADDEIVFAVAATADPVLVVTDDAELRERVRSEGGNVLGTVHLLGAIDG
jgi:hypothetical protein